MKDCDNCKHSETWAYAVPCSNCYGASNWEEIKQTNADRIRSMTDEELAELLPGKSAWNCPPNTKEKGGCRASGCVSCWLDWLKQEAE